MHDKPYVMTRYTEKQVSVQLILALCLGGVLLMKQGQATHLIVLSPSLWDERHIS